MRLSAPVLRKVTFFTRPRCGLCSEAKQVITSVNNKYPFEYSEIDITQPENKQWYDLYAFDVPVMHFEDKTAKEVVMHRISTEKALDILSKLK